MSEHLADEPLGLTIQTLPGQSQPDDGQGGQRARTRSGRWMMLLVMLACISPIAASYFTFYVIKPQGGASYGAVNSPLGPEYEIPDVPATDLQGKTVSLRSLKGQWLLVSVASGACDPQCQQHLYLQRQIREMLSGEKDRLDWVWLIDDAAPIPADLQDAAAQARTLRVSHAALAAWLKPEVGHQLQDHLYVVDPMGNWMMRFPAQLDYKKAYHDINRLLRASSSWNRRRGVVYE